ncbi:FliH/SctL family protein [Leifsonia sp. NPDC058292]|uniref:FliH/SctL family protein n=1 Tax=Leifsonia sp. NPDC058292 TaxID=3346428 RepID=UPI0036D803B8
MSSDVAFSRLPIPVLAETEQSHAAAQSARARGYAAGYAEGLRVAATEQSAWLAAAEQDRAQRADLATQHTVRALAVLRAAALELTESTLPVVEDAEGTLVAAAFELAEAVVGHALGDRLAAAEAAVARVLGDDLAGQVSVIRLNPDDAAAIAETATELPVRLVADPAVAAGDAIGELPDGWLDARIRTALDRAREAIA